MIINFTIFALGYLIGWLISENYNQEKHLIFQQNLLNQQERMQQEQSSRIAFLERCIEINFDPNHN